MLESKTINEIIELTFKKGSIYDEIMDNIIGNKKDIKSQLISEIAFGFLHNQEKVIKAWDEGYYKYYYTRALTNQVHSNTSPLHRNNVIKERGFDAELILNEDTEYIQYKEDLEIKYEQLELAINTVKVSWFDGQLFQEYYVNNKSYRQIGEEYDINHVHVWQRIKETKDKIKKWISDNT